MNKIVCSITLLVFASLMDGQGLFAQKQARPIPPLTVEKGHIMYTSDSLGNRIPDFSYAGFKASEEAIPVIAAKVVVPLINGDATAAIQAAINYVGSLPLDAQGFRGAVLLLPGKYAVFGQLTIAASGVVLRGSGTSTNGTQLIGMGKDRATLIRVVGKNDQQLSTEQKITEPYIPVQALRVSVPNIAAFAIGDGVVIHRPSTLNWIKTLGTEHFGGGITTLGWKPGEQDLFFDRKITAIEGNAITLDAPITTALDTAYGGGYLSSYTWNGRIHSIGIENLQLLSAFNTSNLKDEDHRWMAITIENAMDVWVRQTSFQYFAGSAVMVLETAKRVTIEDCISRNPIAEIGGERRNTFYTAGQQTLFQRCVAFDGNHDFATGFCAPGPNAFVQCASNLPHNFSGAIDSWASGILFDAVTVDGNALRFGNRGQDGQGAGWAAANSLFWNCSAARIDCYKPPTAQNWSFGSWSQFAGDGYWTESNNSINPLSLFYAQLSERLKRNTSLQSQLLTIDTDASSSPPVDVAMQLTKAANQPRKSLTEWIEDAAKRNPINCNPAGIKTIVQIGIPQTKVIEYAPPLRVQNGWLVRNNTVQSGRRTDVPWWSGGIHARDLKQAKPAITRFVPGRVGNGFTDDLQEVTDGMVAKNTIAIEQHYGLWYDRRRDDHERIRRMDGDVWAPFYELPFARTGIETAWDGLSKYDLTQYNRWYWSRMKQFADLADQKGLILIHQNYFQHNIIEAGAHYVDFPWRTANNINQVGFPEPVNFAGDKRIFMAEQFYDTTIAIRNEIHKKYIWQCLDNFSGNSGVIQLIGDEFTGPLQFVQFWVDAIRSWENRYKKSQMIGLSTTKDLQDAILQDVHRNATIDLIDIRYWHYQADGTVYAPAGGQNLAPRQHARLLKPKRTSFEQVYRAVKEYSTTYPTKAVMYSSEGADQFGWAVFMAKGSLPTLPPNTSIALLQAAATMYPVESAGVIALANANGLIAYAGNEKQIHLNLSTFKGVLKVHFVNLANGQIIDDVQTIEGGKEVDIRLPQNAGMVWCTK